MLDALPPHAHPDLLVGLGRADDAAVYRLGEDLAVVGTVDFFPPIVDDPYAFGGIAAANAMSDVYAMGGHVLFALNIAGFPREFPKEVIVEIFRGGADKVREAGGTVAGGHTVVDAEPKYGLCVTGRADPRRLLLKGGLRAGDRLFLSKPLGTGVVTTAAKGGHCGTSVLAAATTSMLRLNRAAAEVALEAGAHGATDVTGFGFLGHAAEMVAASGTGLSIRARDLPVLPGALALAERGHWSGGMGRNRRYLEETLVATGRLALDPALSPAEVGILFESETSGGLLFSVAPERSEAVRGALERRGEPCWEIGEVTDRPRIVVA